MLKNLSHPAQTFSNLIDFIESENFVYSCTLAILLVQTFISASLFHRITHHDFSFELQGLRFTVLDWMHAFAFAFAIESAVLMLVVNAKKQGAVFYAIGSFLCCMLYFRDWEHLVYGGWYEKLPSILATTIYSLMISCSVFYFSDLFAAKLAERKSKRATKPSKPDFADSKHINTKPANLSFTDKQSTEQSQRELPSLNSSADIVIAKQTNSQSQFICSECNRSFATQKALNGHMRTHAKF